MWRNILERTDGFEFGQALQTNTVLASAVVLGVALVLAALGRRTARGGVEVPAGLFSFFPVYVVAGAAVIMKWLEWSLSKAAILLALASVVVVAGFLQTAGWAVYAINGETTLPENVRDGLVGFENGVRLFMGLYVLMGAGFFALGKLVQKSQSSKPSRAVVISMVALSVTCLVLLIAVPTMAMVRSVEFFHPGGDANVGFNVLYASTRGDLGQALLCQLVLSPLYAYVVNTILVPVLMVIYFVVAVAVRETPGDGTRRAILNKVHTLMLPVSAGVVLSFCITIVAPSLVVFAGGTQSFHPSPTFLLINATGDAFTIGVTVGIVAAILAIGQHMLEGAPGVLRRLHYMAVVLGLVVLDVLLAAVAAVLVIYFGVESSGHSLTWRETLFHLFGLSANGAHVELNSIFMVMHTTFIPSLVLLSAVFVAAILVPVWMVIEWVLPRIPNTLTSFVNLIGKVGWVFSALGFAVSIGWSLSVFRSITETQYVTVVQNLVGLLS